MDPSAVNLKEWLGREAEGIKIMPRAGEILYRIKNTPRLS
jgi:hypothetical protein